MKTLKEDRKLRGYGPGSPQASWQKKSGPAKRGHAHEPDDGDLNAVLPHAHSPGFHNYDCNNQHSVVESYSLQEPDIGPVSHGNGTTETTAYGVLIKLKQDGIIPVFRC
jgi:hypothetical protein